MTLHDFRMIIDTLDNHGYGNYKMTVKISNKGNLKSLRTADVLRINPFEEVEKIVIDTEDILIKKYID